jgi:hypothetical protein
MRRLSRTSMLTLAAILALILTIGSACGGGGDDGGSSAGAASSQPAGQGTIEELPTSGAGKTGDVLIEANTDAARKIKVGMSYDQVDAMDNTPVRAGFDEAEARLQKSGIGSVDAVRVDVHLTESTGGYGYEVPLSDGSTVSLTPEGISQEPMVPADAPYYLIFFGPRFEPKSKPTIAVFKDNVVIAIMRAPCDPLLGLLEKAGKPTPHGSMCGFGG